MNVSTGIYAKGHARLLASLQSVGCSVPVVSWVNQLPPGCPLHAQVPYAFKTYALRAAQAMGYDVLLWLDASMLAVGSLEPLFQHIEEHGHRFELAGHWLGWWSTDAFLRHHKLSRDQAMTIPMFSAGFAGLDLRHPQSAEFLRRWHAMAQDGVSFIGPWQDSGSDPRYKGHRHDMSAGSLLAHQLGMPLSGEPRFMVYDIYTPNPGPEVCVFCRGV